MSSIEPYIGSDHEHSSEKDLGGFIVAGGDSAELLEPSEEILNQVARFVQVFVIGAGSFSVGFWRDDRDYSGLFQRFYDSFIGVKGLVTKKCPRGNFWQKSVCAFKVAGLARSENEVQGVAESIDDGVDFRRQPAF